MLIYLSPILHLPDNKGRSYLYSDTNTFTRGSALYRLWTGRPNLIKFASVRIPDVAKNYSIMKLELCSLAINKQALLIYSEKKFNFDSIVEHLAFKHIIKVKTESATNRKKLLEVLSSYSFNCYYIKGKDMMLSDFLSWQKHNNSNLHEVIPISFSRLEVLYTKC